MDPARRALEAYLLGEGKGRQILQAEDDQVISIPPFDAIGLELATSWN